MHKPKNKTKHRRHNNNKPARVTRQDIKQIQNEIAALKEAVLPIIREREAVQEARIAMIVSCDASCNKDKVAATGLVIRSVALPDTFTAGRLTKAQSSNEAELDAIYVGLDTLSYMLLHSVRDHRVKYVEVRSDSQLCVDWINRKKKTFVEKLSKKIDIVRELANNISLMNNKKVTFVWKRRNSTFDLNWANNLAQDVLGIKNH